jgi:hypothetical protein
MKSQPNELMKFDADGPTWSRQPIQFKNWEAPGLAISGATLTTDAKMFREIAGLLRTINGDNWATINAVALDTLAGQYERAVKGETAQAK